MYDVNREDARSDLMLSGAVFVFGPVALALLLRALGIIGLLGRTGVQVLQIALAVAVTMLVPLLLMKYRGERPAAVLGLGAGDRSVPTGLLAAVPLLVAGAALIAIGDGAPIREHPLLAILAGDPLNLVARLAAWGGVIGLALYVTVKARDGFGGMPSQVEETVWRIGRILAIVAVVGTVIRVLIELIGDGGPAEMVGLVVWPVAVAATIWVTLRRTTGPATTTVPTLVTPTVIAAVGNLNLFAPIDTLYSVPLSGGLGLAVGIMAERTRRGGGILVFAVLVALGTGLPAPLRLG